MARKKVENNIYYDDIRKTYYISLYYGTDEQGKLIQRTKTTKNIREARKILHEHEVDKSRQQAIPSSRETVAEYLRWYLENVVKPHREPTTYYGYERIVEKHIIPVLGSYKLDKLNAANIQEYITQKCNQGLSGNSVIKHIDLLKTALTAAVGSGKILKNPANFVTRPKKVKTEVRPYSREDVIRAIKMAKEDCEWLYITLILAAYTGMRREEILGLRWDNIDFDECALTVKEVRTTAGDTEVIKEPKTASSYRKLRIAPPLLAVLKEEKKRQEELKNYFESRQFNPKGYVVIADTGKLPNPNAVNNKIAYLAKTKGFPAIKLHGLRHTFASLSHEYGASAFETQHALGHSSTAVTLGIYTHLYQEANDTAMGKVAEALSEQLQKSPKNAAEN